MTTLIIIAYIILCILLILFDKDLKELWIGKESFVHLLEEINTDISKVESAFKRFGVRLLMCILFILLFLLLFLFTPIELLWFLVVKKEDTPKDTWQPEPPINPKYFTPPAFIRFRKDLPFVPNSQQIIFVDSAENAQIREALDTAYDALSKYIEGKYYRFIYLPRLKTAKESVSYAFSQNSKNEIAENEITVRSVTDLFLSFAVDDLPAAAGFLRYKKPQQHLGQPVEEEYYSFSFYALEEPTDILEQVRAYMSRVGDQGPMYSLCCRPEIAPQDTADNAFSYEAAKIVNEIKEKIEQLRQIGINEMMMKSIFCFDDTPKLSRMLITADYRIFLPDYRNMEIKMTPLPKAVYFLFLHHPEGVLFKHLPDYKSELMDIYMEISKRENLPDIQKSIDDVTDPAKNAINEKCSRIREAFIAHFDETLAQNYFITGERSEPKKIILDRNLVHFENLGFLQALQKKNLIR